MKALPSLKDVGFSIGRCICSQLRVSVCVGGCGSGEDEMPRYLYQQQHLTEPVSRDDAPGRCKDGATPIKSMTRDARRSS